MLLRKRNPLKSVKIAFWITHNSDQNTCLRLDFTNLNFLTLKVLFC